MAGYVEEQEVVAAAIGKERLDLFGHHMRWLIDHRGPDVEATDVRIGENSRQLDNIARRGA